MAAVHLDVLPAPPPAAMPEAAGCPALGLLVGAGEKRFHLGGDTPVAVLGVGTRMKDPATRTKSRPY